MLDRNQLLAVLESRSNDFTRFERKRHQAVIRLRDSLSRLEARGRQALEASLQAFDTPGAFPTPELDRGLIPPFPRTFQHHPEALSWAQAQLEGRTSFAADGSQIEPDERYSIPVALIQIGSYENHHLPEGSYRRETALQVLTPDDLDGEGPVKRLIDLARFEAEIETLIRFMHERATEDPGVARPLVFLDGSLVVSFAEKQSKDPHALRYVSRILALLEASQKTRTPLVAYVDGSRAKDLARMTALAAGEEAEGVSDALLLEGRLRWGDRTAAFRCAREGILDSYGRHRREIGFCYLQTREGHPPARLEFPLWMQDALDAWIDAVRADVIAGGGYPYTLAAADATAVLNASDRDRFLRTIEDFLSRNEIPFSFSTKALSKLRRR